VNNGAQCANMNRTRTRNIPSAAPQRHAGVRRAVEWMAGEIEPEGRERVRWAQWTEQTRPWRQVSNGRSNHKQPPLRPPVRHQVRMPVAKDVPFAAIAAAGAAKTARWQVWRVRVCAWCAAAVCAKLEPTHGVAGAKAYGVEQAGRQYGASSAQTSQRGGKPPAGQQTTRTGTTTKHIHTAR